MDLTEKQIALHNFTGQLVRDDSTVAHWFNAGWDAAIESAFTKFAAFFGQMEIQHGHELKGIVARRVPIEAVATLIDSLKAIETKEFEADADVEVRMRMMAEKALADYFKAVGEDAE